MTASDQLTCAAPSSFLTLRDDLRAAYEACDVLVPYRPVRYDPGDELTYEAVGVSPRWEGTLRVQVERFVGGGFAGQVYRVRLVDLVATDARRCDSGDLIPGAAYALKLLRPPSGGAARFRNALYALGYQAAFAPHANYSAVRAGALWQKVIRRAAGVWFGDERAVCDTYATLHDEQLRTFGVLNEWVDGRIWKFEVDDRLFHRWRFRGDVPAGHNCPEYVGKRLFMRSLVQLLHEVGAGELARQYEWWTCKSQPNALLRKEGSSPYAGLTAIDFAAGLVLLPLLPMSPGDVALILRGLARGRLVQFDRGDLARLQTFVARHAECFEDLRETIRELHEQETAYRRLLPDLTCHGIRAVMDPSLRASIREGAIEAWRNVGRVDQDHAELLRARRSTFLRWYVASGIPVVGPLLLRLWGDGVTRRHVVRCVTSASYLSRALRGDRASVLVEWARARRIGPERARATLNRPVRFAIERLFLSWLPWRWHRAVAEPAWAWRAIKMKVGQAMRFLRDPSYREEQLVAEVAEGRREGMLTDHEADRVIAQIKDPYIQKYLRCLAVHVCTLPVTQVVMLIVGVAVTLYCVVYRRMPWPESVGLGTAAAATIQLLPISPGSISRGIFVLYLMIKERDIKNYYIAAPISFIHVLGYLAFPFQMVTHDPALARFLAGRWTRRVVNAVPVFGEHGALLEHGVFDMFFNFPLSVARLLRRRRDPPEA